MRYGTVISVPNDYSNFARVRDENGLGYTVEPRHLLEDTEVDDDVAYKVELWENDSGLIYSMEED